MMKKSGLNFLSRRNQSLFDTNVQMKDMENVEFVFDAVMIPDSGTAKVRSRPTVKHFSTFGDGAGFAVPTPTVPDVPSFTITQISHTGRTDSLSNGGTISVHDLKEGQILIPPPPSTAPPPPPPQFIPPSPGHVAPLAALSPIDLCTPAPPSMPPPKPPSLGRQDDVDLSMIKPPSMAPPKPPSYQISAVSPEDIPECPKFTPPMPPTDKPQPSTTTVQKIPPPKPTRFSSVSNLELPPSGLTTPISPSLGKPSSSFSSLNTSKLNTAPKNTILTEQSDRTQPMFLENNPGTPAGVRSPKLENVSPVKPVRRNSSAIKLEDDLQNLKESMQAKLHDQPSLAARVPDSVAARGDASPNVTDKIPSSAKGSTTAKGSAAVLSAQDLMHLTSVEPALKYSPLLNRKLQNQKTNEPLSGKEATTPLALLMAAKERERQRTAVSRENSTKSIRSVESTRGNVQPNDIRINSFTVTPRPPVYPGDTSPFMEPQSHTENPNVATSRTKPSVHSSSIPTIASPTSPSALESIAYIPPPPEFANSDPEDEALPTMPPPARRTDMMSPLNSAPLLNGSTNPPTNKSSSTTPGSSNTITQFKPKAPPPTQPKTPPQVLPPPRIPTQVLPPPPPKIQSPPSVVAGQATLLSILQKKMLEMDPKLTHAREADGGGDEWNSEDVGGISTLNSTPKDSSFILDRKELENKTTKKATASVSSKQQFGMTFLVRPGNKQPITPVSKTE